MGSLERYRKRKVLLKKTSGQVAYVEELSTLQIDTDLMRQTTQIMESHYAFEYDFSVSREEAKEFLEKFKKDFNQERFDKLIADCKKDVINSIVTPFGLGKIVAAYDKVGGNVDTVHNARNGIYATDEERETYENRGEYDDREKKRTHGGNPNYKTKKDNDNRLRQKGELQNDYNNSTFQIDDTTEVDHVISTYENHNDAGRVLAEIDNAEISNMDANLKTASKSLNASKGEDSVEALLKRIDKKEIKIKELESYPNLSDKQKQELQKLKRTSDVDKEKLLNADKEAREARDQKINEAYYGSKKFAKNVSITGALEGSKMGMQQAIGLVMTEFFTALLDEILDIYKKGFASGFEDERFLNVLQERLKRIAKKIKAKWKNVALAFKDGFLSGFVSNLVTTAINMFKTTKKNIVKIIREGMFSLFKAVKILVFPPEHLSYEEAMQEAKKLIATGLMVSLGVFVETAVSELIKTTAVLAPFADILTAIFVGTITGLAVTMTAYYLDQKKNEEEAMSELVLQTNAKLDNAEKLLIELHSYGN